MNKIISFILAVLLWQDVISQSDSNAPSVNLTDSLEGKWRGEFYNEIYAQNIPIELVFERKKGRLQIYTYGGYVRDSYAVACQVDYKKIRSDSIWLTELLPIESDNPKDLCRQIMYLHIAKVENELVMTGTWETYGNRSRRECGKGTIYFNKDR